jgi:hypothetical protein
MAMDVQSCNFLRLVLRSNDVGGGWRVFTNVTWQLVREFKYQELLDVEPNNDGFGRVRLSERGKIVAEYVL